MHGAGDMVREGPVLQGALTPRRAEHEADALRVRDGDSAVRLHAAAEVPRRSLC